MINTSEKLQEKFKVYLQNILLDKELEIVKNNLVSFHWSNWNLTCRMIKEGPLCLYTKDAIVEDLNNRIEDLRNQKVWVNNKLQTIETNVHDLYQFYMDPRVRGEWFRREQSALYSDESQKGPFSLVTSLKWKRRKTFSYFVFKKILLESHQLRKFRLNANLPFKIKIDEFKQNDIDAQVKQFSANGVLVELKNNSRNSKLRTLRTSTFEFRISDILPLTEYLESGELPFEGPIQINVNLEQLFENQAPYRDDQAEQFVFIPYHFWECNQSGNFVSNILKDIVFQVYTDFDEAISSDLSSFHSWVKKVS